VIIVNCKNRKIESALKEYRQKADRIGIVRELRDRQTFEKPSVKRRKMITSAKYRNQKYGNNEF
jgi:small subunit ribosomal protein S21